MSTKRTIAKRSDKNLALANKRLAEAIPGYLRYRRECKEGAAVAFDTTPADLHGQFEAIQQIADLALHGRVVDFPNGEETLSEEDSRALDTHLYDLHSALRLIAGLARGWQAMLDSD